MTVLGLVQLIVFKRRAHGFEDLRAILRNLEHALQDGGLPDGRQAARDLADAADRLRSRSVQGHARRVSAAWTAAVESDPGPWVFVLGGVEDAADRQHWAEVDAHKAMRAECLAAIKEARRMMNRQERLAVPSLR
jgi:hypothetical protein